MTELADCSGVIDEASNLAALKLLIFETANTYLKNNGIEPESNMLRGITQRISVTWLRKLRDAEADKAGFEAETERIVARVVYEYAHITHLTI
jgi:hypothetical protein